MGKVETDGIRAKLTRAREHLEQLDREMAAFTHRRPFVVVELPKPKVNVLSWGIRLTEPIPISWGVIMGEIAHDLRSALDNAIYELSVERLNKRPDDKTGFPIFDSPDEFANRGGERQIKHVGEAVKAFVRSLQTFNSHGTAALNLLSLHRIWNQDKHRVVQPWGLQLTPEAHTLKSTPPFKGIRFNADIVHDEHTEALRMWWDSNPGEVKMEGYCDLTLSFDDPADTGPGTERNMWSLHDSAAAVCLALISMIGRQDEPPF